MLYCSNDYYLKHSKKYNFLKDLFINYLPAISDLNEYF